MLARTVTILALVTANVAAAQTPAKSSPWTFLGTWTFNAAKSDVQTTRLTFTQAASGEMTMTASGVSYAFRIDGKPRPAMMGSTAIWTENGPRSWKTVYRLAGADNNIDTYNLSPDGKTLTMQTERLVPQRNVETATFTRVSGSAGLIGVWQTRNLENVDFQMTLTSSDPKTVTVAWSWGGTAVATVDGRDVPVKGAAPAVPPSLTTSFTLVTPNTFDLVLKDKGQQIYRARYVVSGDGRVMTADVRNGPDGPAQERTKVVLDKR